MPIDRHEWNVFAAGALLAIGIAVGGAFVGYLLGVSRSEPPSQFMPPPPREVSELELPRAPGVDEYEEHINWVSIIKAPPRHAEAYGASQVILQNVLQDRGQELLTLDYVTYYPLPDDGSGKLRHGWRIRGLLGGDSLVAHLEHEVVSGFVRDPAWKLTYLKVQEKVIPGYEKPLPGVSTEKLSF